MILRETFTKTASWGAKWVTGAPAGGAHTQRYATADGMAMVYLQLLLSDEVYKCILSLVNHSVPLLLLLLFTITHIRYLLAFIIYHYCLAKARAEAE